jgi:tetratricopeptide (TPR) repeat protein
MFFEMEYHYIIAMFAQNNNMKKSLIITFALIAIYFPSTAQINMPAPSPTQTIIQDFGLGKITLIYSRPGIKGRQAFGENSELAPLGKPWRTGANAATKIHFTDKVSIGGKDLDSGSYVIYTIPGKNQWDVVFSKGTAYPGSQGFTTDDDVLHYKAPVVMNKEKVESFTMQFSDLKNESCNLHFKWANTDVSVPVTTIIKEKIRAQIESALQGDKPPYYQAANFYYDYDKDYKKALEYINKATEENPKAFYMFLQKARIQKAMGDKTGAKATAQKTIELAKEAGNADYVNFGNKLLKEL